MPPRRSFADLAAVLLFLGILLLSAGRLDYWQGWAYASLGLIMSLATRLILRSDPELEKERSKPGAGAEAWDKKLLGSGLLLTVAMLIVAGLDSGRYHWFPQLSWIWSLPGVLLNFAGMAIFLLALKENRFFSTVVRIQKDRKQTVCKTGPYSVIRHPGNAGMIIGTMGLPLLFMSAWSAIPVLISVIVIVIRTHWEDILLKEELEGYQDYHRITLFRLIPGIW